MDLKKFISQSLVEIMDGIKDAQDQLNGRSHGRICPTFSPHGRDDKHVVGANVSGRPITLVDYDVAVEAASETNGGGGIKVLGGLINLQGTGAMKDIDKVVSRLRFSIPVVYPDIADE